MKTSHHPRHRSYGVEWLQACITLVVLSGIYFASDNFESYTSQYAPKPDSQKSQSSYWNDRHGYGFRGLPEDTYNAESSPESDHVVVTDAEGLIFKDRTVQVSFYPNATLDSIEKKHTASVSRAYSRLSNGIAVIEGDLASATAKTVLATLHAR